MQIPPRQSSAGATGGIGQGGKVGPHSWTHSPSTQKRGTGHTFPLTGGQSVLSRQSFWVVPWTVSQSWNALDAWHWASPAGSEPLPGRLVGPMQYPFRQASPVPHSLKSLQA